MIWHREIFMALQLTASAYAIGWGGKPERYVGAAQLVAYLLSMELRKHGIGGYVSLQTTVMAIDLVLTAFLLAIAWRADRWWPSLMAAMSIVTLLGHAAHIVELDLSPRVYRVLIIAWAYPMVALLFVATWRHRKRIAVSGPEADWKHAAGH